MNRKRDLDAFHKGQQNTHGSAKDQEEVPNGRPKKVSKIVKTEPTDNRNGSARSLKVKEYVGPKQRGIHLAFSLEQPRHVKSPGGAACANCGGDDHTASRCIGPWDPVSGTIKVCVLCNDASHGLDDCPILVKRTPSDKRFVLSRYLILYRGGRAPIESSVCWVDLLSSTEFEEMLPRRSPKEGSFLYPWTREFAISQHKNQPWKYYQYVNDCHGTWTWWSEDPKTNSEAVVQKNLESLKKTESLSGLKAMACQKMMESESEREWELTAAGLKAWPDILAIAPKLKAYVEEEDN
ncbi:hypothetical protein B0H65DRAFT_587490 [Neurospora tetraspora]|uniref:Uncharacterized protein n=1 Tax=Neurospora tetraspora TaxID=94610 RepID=A0AAE0JH41_9PEZI|nr:hypothetical protein B0H65DRAFT_587490 [Neurospora tetraspora]